MLGLIGQIAGRFIGAADKLTGGQGGRQVWGMLTAAALSVLPQVGGASPLSNASMPSSPGRQSYDPNSMPRFNPPPPRFQ